MNINNEMFESFEFVLAIVVIAQELFNKFRLALFERNVVWVTAQNILEFTFQFVDIVIRLSTKLKLDFFVSCLGSLLLFGPFVEILAQIIDDSVVMVAVLLPK